MDKEVIANIKGLAIDMIAKAGSGHPGIVLGAAPIIYTLYNKHINVSTSDSKWINRDRFVLSAGHGSALLYATLHLAGYDLLIEDLKNFRKLGSKTPGHPEVNVTDGVDMSTGPLGQGFASAVGMALAEKMLEARYVIPSSTRIERNRSLINYRVYCLCGDGDIMEGITTEAASLAGNLNLDNLIVLYDSNNVSLDGDTSCTFTEKVLDKFKAMGWYTDIVRNGNDTVAIDKAIEKAKNAGMPAIIEIKTVIGDGSLLAGTNAVHGKVLDPKDIEQLKTKLGLPQEEFYINTEAIKEFRKNLLDRGSYKYEEWSHNYKLYVDEVLKGDRKKLDFLFTNKVNVDLLRQYWDLDPSSKIELRASNQMVLDKISSVVPTFVGGSADVASSTHARISKSPTVTDGHYNGKNICFGVRESAMGAILNGMCLSGFRPFGSTFLAFSDYMKPAMRMSALMKLPVTYIFTHDSVSIGPDGPTHQPVEQLATLRAMPNMNVYRPADVKELIGCWNIILNTHDKPSSLVITKNPVSIIPGTDAGMCGRGAYLVRREENLHGIIIATGQEVHTALILANELYNKYKLDLRVVSMPCMELFLEQPINYRESLIPKGYRTFVLEAGSSFGWHQFVYDNSYLLTVDEFGISASKSDVEKHVGIDFVTLKQRILDKFIKKWEKFHFFSLKKRKTKIFVV